jgi:hypothetical protein
MVLDFGTSDFAIVEFFFGLRVWGWLFGYAAQEKYRRFKVTG